MSEIHTYEYGTIVDCIIKFKNDKEIFDYLYKERFWNHYNLLNPTKPKEDNKPVYKFNLETSCLPWPWEFSKIKDKGTTDGE